MNGMDLEHQEVDDEIGDKRMTFEEHAETNNPHVLEPEWLRVHNTSKNVRLCHACEVCCLHLSVACTTFANVCT